MRARLASLLLFASLTACGARTVSVESAPPPASTVTLTVTNSLSDPVNVYVVTGSTETFVQTVSGNTTSSLSVKGVQAGTVVQLKATTSDGSKTYTKAGVTLQATNTWNVP